MLKRICLPVLLFLTGMAAEAQFKKGDRMLGANIAGISFTGGRAEYTAPGVPVGYETKSSNFNLGLSPSIGWFLNEKVAVGATLNVSYGRSTLRNIANDTTYYESNASQLNLGLGGFIRNYFKTGTGTLPFVQASINFGTGSGNTDGFSFSSDVGGKYKDVFDGKKSGIAFFNASLIGGFTKMVNDRVGLDFFAGYNFSFNKNTSTSTTVRSYITGPGTGFTANYETDEKFTGHGATIGIGFQIFLEGKKK